MAAKTITYTPDDSYLDYLNAVKDIIPDNNLDKDITYLELISHKMAGYLSDVHISQNGTNFVSNRRDIEVRICSADNDPRTIDSLDYKKYPLHIELFHTGTKQLIRLLPSPTREPVVFYTLYEMGGRPINRVTGATSICYEGICGTEILFGGMMASMFYHFLNKEYGSSVMDYTNYLNFH